MQKIEITYNPYKMETTLLINGVNICNNTNEYGQFKEFFDTHTPLQIWIEPIAYKNWKGIINELKPDEEGFDILEIHFNGRAIDFEDLKRVCIHENDNRRNPIGISFKHDIIISDKKLAQNVDVIMDSLLSDRFAKLVKEQGEKSSANIDYQSLKANYDRAKQKEFKIVFAGLYSSGKSTILNALIRHNVLPASDKTCTAKTCKIRHDSRLKTSVTLECFDIDGNVVVPKETFSNDSSCLTRFWEITPLGAMSSVPDTVDTIELCMDLSHLYPSREMEKAFKLVIVDTPGSNSSKKIGLIKDNANSEGILENSDKKVALESITNGDREMVVICADAQDYDDESIGDFLKAIHEVLREDIGDFNDRFLFVLNKCDALKFNNNEKIADSKNDFAKYLMNTKRWGIRQTSLNFVPRIFMTSGYNSLALQQGASHFSDEELINSGEKQNLFDSYDDFYKKVIKRKNRNYFLSQVCDVPDYRKKQYEHEFNMSIKEGDSDKALELQTGVCCIEGAIQDYIARYAYPLKVKSLIETFDLLLESVKDFSDVQVRILEERMADMGKDTTEREEVKKSQKSEEEKEAALRKLKEKVETEKSKIEDIDLDMSNLQQVRSNIDLMIEMDPSISSVRGSSNRRKLTEKEMRTLVKNISAVFTKACDDMDKELGLVSNNYKDKVKDICITLNGIAAQLQQFNINGYNFTSSLAIKKIQLRDTESLIKEIKKTKQEKSQYKIREIRNPIKDVVYKKWQIIRRIEQFFAKDTIEVVDLDKWDEYDVAELKEYITETSGEFKQLSADAEKNYRDEINNMKKNASRMAEDMVTDIQSIVSQIEIYKTKIKSLGNNIEVLQAEIDSRKENISWLNDLIDIIRNGGRING